MNTNYIAHSFNFDMIETFPVNVKFEKIDKEQIPEDCKSIIARANMATIIGNIIERYVEVNENPVERLNIGDSLYIVQISFSERPTEEMRTLPEGSTYEVFKVSIS